MMNELRSDLHEFKIWIKAHRWEAAFVGLFSLFISGIRLFYHDIGIDSECMFTEPDMYNYIWCCTGRYGLVLTKKLLGFSRMIPFAANLLGVLFLFGTVTVFSWLVSLWSNGKISSRYFYPAFSSVFLSSPILAEQFYFTLQSMEIAWAMLLSVAASYFSGKAAYTTWTRRTFLWCIPAITCMIWAFATYQSFTLFTMVLILISYLITYQTNRDLHYLSAGLKQAGIFLFSLAGWWIIDKFLCKFFFEKMTYTSGMFMWRHLPVSACLDTIQSEWIRFSTGSIFFYSKWCLPVMLLSVTIFFVYSIRHRFKQIPCLFLAIFLYILSPVLLIIVTGGGTPMRSRIFYPLAFAFSFAFSLSVIHKQIMKYMFLIVLILSTWQQAGYSLSLQETTHVAYECDRNLMLRILSRMEEKANWGLRKLPVVFVGKIAPDLPADVLRGETIGHSFFEWDANYHAGGNHRIAGFASVVGTELTLADEEQRKAAVDVSFSMEPWPAENSIQIKDNVMIVKLSSPEKTDNHWWYSGGWHYWTNDFSDIITSDWVEIDGDWYYFNQNGDMVTGSQSIGGKEYCFNEDGIWIEE